MKYTTALPELAKVQIVALSDHLDQKGITTSIRHEIDEAMYIEHDCTPKELRAALEDFDRQANALLET